MSDRLLQHLTHYLLRPTISQKDEDESRFTAAVLVPIIRRPQGPTLLFTQRSTTLRQHPGQVAFPGGKRDTSDQSLYHTALRETYEEIGITAKDITPLGALPKVHSRRDHLVKPYLTLIEPTFALKLNPDEVAQVFELPLLPLLNKRHYVTLPLGSDHRDGPLYFLRYSSPLIWGMTARILFDLAESMAP